jgi:hypothetical protein
MRRVIRPAGVVTSACFLEKSPLFTTVSGIKSKAQKDGLRYERRTQDYVAKLARLAPSGADIDVLLNPWLLYHTRNDGPTVALFCQPDILLVSEGKVTIIEVKLSHTNDSYEQMRLVYEPVLKKVYPQGTEFALLEICKWYDPHTRYAEQFYYCENPLEAVSGKLGIHIYKPRGRVS